MDLDVDIFTVTPICCTTDFALACHVEGQIELTSKLLRFPTPSTVCSKAHL